MPINNQLELIDNIAMILQCLYLNNFATLQFFITILGIFS